VGHLAHMNLHDSHAEYKYLIGQVVLDKNARLRTVVTKCGTIHAQFRFARAWFF
jgi:tRNA (guanine37-N1)-methyltransferase